MRLFKLFTILTAVVALVASFLGAALSALAVEQEENPMAVSDSALNAPADVLPEGVSDNMGEGKPATRPNAPNRNILKVHDGQADKKQ